MGGEGARERWEAGREEREAEARARQEKPPVPPTKVTLKCFFFIFFMAQFMYTNVFQSAEILEKNICQAAYIKPGLGRV